MIAGKHSSNSWDLKWCHFNGKTEYDTELVPQLFMEIKGTVTTIKQDLS